jgi:corrinoid protein of di/trimethylamine methyltransferase
MVIEMTEEEILACLKNAVINCDSDAAVSAAKRAIEAGINPIKAIESGLAEGIKIVGERFERFEAFLPHLVIASDTMTAAVKVLEPYILEKKLKIPTLGKVVIGTVEGDIHDLGKSIVGAMLRTAGFEVRDLGVDVPVEKFVEEAVAINADIIAISALLTSSRSGQKDVIDELWRRGLRGKFKVLVGGGAVTTEYAKAIGADAYAPNAIEVVRVAKALVGKE